MVRHLKVLEKLKQRIRSSIPLAFARLVYLASLRDYNTDHYTHAGWAFDLTEDGADRALRELHREEFQRLVGLPVAEMVQELAAYFESLQEPSGGVLVVWSELESFRALVPRGSHPVDRDLFFSSIRAALAVLGAGGLPFPLAQSASLPPSPDL